MDKECEWCGRIFKMTRYKTRFCSRECSTIASKNGMVDHSCYTPTLCWECANYVDGCEWMAEGEPVKGWKAKKTRRGCEIESYNVKECPKFLRDSYGDKWIKTFS